MQDLQGLACSSFDRVSHLLDGCLLYLDGGAGEALAANVGIDYLLNKGVVNVCALECASRRDAAAHHLLSGLDDYSVVVVTTKLLTDIHGYLIKMHQEHERAEAVTILCSCSEAAHAGQPATMLGEHAYDSYLSALKEDLEQARKKMASEDDKTEAPNGFKTTVQHFPLPACVVDSATFVLPAASSAAVSARIGAHIAGLGPPDAVPGDDGLDAPAATGLKLLAHSLLDLASELGVRLDTFSLGPLSNIMGDEICAMPAPTPPTETAALVLVDRCLDLVTPLSHADHVLDQIYGTLQRRCTSGHNSLRTSDVIVPLPSVFGSAKQSDIKEATSDDGEAGTHTDEQQQPRQTSNGAASTSGLALQGSLYGPSDAQMGQWREFLATRKGKDAALFLRKWMREALRKAGIQTKMRFKAGSVPAEEFRALADLLAAAPPKVCFGQLSIMQLGYAAAAALDGAAAARWARLAQLEQDIIHLSANGMDEELAEKVCGVVLEAASKTAETGITAADALGLCVVALALACDAGAQRTGASELRSRMSQTLVDALLEGTIKPQDLGLSGSLSPHHKELESKEGETGEEAKYEIQALRLEMSDKVTELLMRLQATAAARSLMKDMRRYLQHGAGSKGVTSLLSQLTSRLLDHQPIPDLQHNNASLGGLLKSGLGRFGLVQQKQPQPGDHNTIIIFVVGGISMADIREVRHITHEMVSAQPGRVPVNVLLGGTSLMSPQHVIELLK
ncbi:probable Sec1 family domain-containing protein 2 [Coccomyxa sp. Obi]|nr:probable Sec1 family domain-containing protein 2 [Coccomyxa sp. Obi]